MPPRPTTPHTAKLEINWLGPNNVKATNIMYLESARDISSEPDLQDCADGVAAALIGAGSWQSQISNDWSLVEVRVIDNSGATENVAVNNTVTAGAVGSVAVNPNTALVMSYPIAAHYRGGHPRTYVAGVPASSIATPGGNEWSTGTQSTWESIGITLLGAVASMVVGGVADVLLGTISYYTGGAARAVPIFKTFLDVAVGSRLDSQRRRLGKESPLV